MRKKATAGLLCVAALHFVDQWLVNTPAGAFCFLSERADGETTCFPLGLRQLAASLRALQNSEEIIFAPDVAMAIASAALCGAPCRGFAAPINGDRR